MHVQVLGALNDCYQIQLDGDFGFMAKKSVSKNFIRNQGSGGGSSGGSSEWSPPVL